MIKVVVTVIEIMILVLVLIKGFKAFARRYVVALNRDEEVDVREATAKGFYFKKTQLKNKKKIIVKNSKQNNKKNVKN